MKEAAPKIYQVFYIFAVSLENAKVFAAKSETFLSRPSISFRFF